VTVRNPSIEVKIIPALHRGPYHMLGMAHKKMYEYLQDERFERHRCPEEAVPQ